MTATAIDQRTFKDLTALVYDSAGIKLGPHKEALVCTRVGKRMRKLGITDFRKYYKHVLNDETGLELTELLNHISTNVTSFFREDRHFEILAEYMKKAEEEGRERIRIWCAACSTGEEAYTIAMTLKESLSNTWDAKILATDISTRAVDIAKKGRYEARHVENVPKGLALKYFSKAGDGSSDFEVSDELKKMITFGRINLSQPPYPLRGPFDVIFCRNVMIYFDNEVRKRLLAHMYDLLRPGGRLMVGHAESLCGMLSEFKSIEPSVYIRT